MAALEAQAVASRTYAITSDAGGSKFDVYSDDRSQVYLGKAAETSRTNAAVAATAGQIVTYAGKPAITYFFAGSGGQTESVQNAFPGAEPEPWLVSVADPYEAGPLRHWTQTLSFATATSRLSGLVKGAFTGIEVLEAWRLAADRVGLRARLEGAHARQRARTGGAPRAVFDLGLFQREEREGDARRAGRERTEPALRRRPRQPANVGGTGGSAATAGTPSSKPAGVDGQGGVPAG